MVKTTSSEKIRAYRGPALFSFGFRPFFLGGAIWAMLAMGLWVGQLSGLLLLPSRFDPVSWHVHELLYGYLPAIAAGFLLTAVPNWTGRLPVVGWPLVVLSSLWLVGRIVVAFSNALPTWLVAGVDLLFLVFFALVVAREILAGENWRNLKVLLLIGALALGNALFHFEASLGAAAYSGYGARLGISIAVLLIMIIGGRIVPSFTRNWLVRREGEILPSPMDRLDVVSIAVSVLALGVWVLDLTSIVLGPLCLFAGIMQLARLWRWRGVRTFAEPLVLILHLGYVFVPLGFLLVGAAALAPTRLGANVAVHSWTAGAIGVMTLAVMTRASLGHSGRPLRADRGTQLIYASIFASVLCRLLAGITGSSVPLNISAALWIFAFAGFAVLYGPLLLRRRVA